MHQKLTIVLLLILPFSHQAQELNRIFPLNAGATKCIGKTYPFPDGSWLYVEEAHSSILTLLQTEYSKIGADGQTIWTWRPALPPGEYFMSYEPEILSDGRVLICGYHVACRVPAPNKRIFLLSSNGEVIWEKNMDDIDLKEINSTFHLSITAQTASDAFWISTGNDSSYVHKFNLGTGQLEWRYSTGQRYWDIKAIPGAHDTLVWYSYWGDLRLYKDSVMVRDITGNNSQIQYIHSVKTYPVAPQIVGTINGNSMLTASMNGDINILTGTRTLDFDIRNGSDLLVTSYDQDNNGRTVRVIRHYSGTNFSQQHIYYIDWINYSSFIQNIHWSGDKVILSCQHQSGIPDGTDANPYRLDPFIQYSSHPFLYTLTLSDQAPQIPGHSDAAISAVKISRHSWQYDQDIFGTVLFKLKGIEIEIENAGADVLQSVVLCTQFKEPRATPCQIDIDYTVKLDQLNLAPGEKKILAIDELPLFRESSNVNTEYICFWLTLPNNQLDLNTGNNYYCVDEMVNKIPAPVGIRVFPNPVKDILMVSISNNEYYAADFQVCNTLGQVILDEKEVLQTGGYFTLNVNRLIPGLYFLRFKDGVFPFLKE